jgi:ABC-type antimicrobial peptide transport system permease subunit
MTPAAGRLAEFNTVENTYLSIFQMLGGLALLLGSFGLGIVVLRNVMERRSELALLRAVGFRKRSLQWLILSEHWLLLLLGLGSGVIAGLVAVLPALRSPGADVPYISLTLTLIAVLLSGIFWTWIATRLALRSPLLVALRNE